MMKALIRLTAAVIGTAVILLHLFTAMSDGTATYFLASSCFLLLLAEPMENA